jgi:hypothetical protein
VFSTNPRCLKSAAADLFSDGFGLIQEKAKRGNRGDLAEERGDKRECAMPSLGEEEG